MEDIKKFDWSNFTVKIPINHSAEKIKEAWMSSAQLEKWFLKVAEFYKPNGDKRTGEDKIQPGDSYRWQWFGWPESVEEKGEILKPENDEFLRFVFGKAGTVGVSIFKEQNENILILKQENIPLDDKSRMNFYVGCKTGWTFYLLNLKSLLLGGIDLRNKRSVLQMD